MNSKIPSVYYVYVRDGGSLKVDLPRRKTNYRVQRALSAAQSQISCTLGPRKQAERN